MRFHYTLLRHITVIMTTNSHNPIQFILIELHFVLQPPVSQTDAVKGIKTHKGACIAMDRKPISDLFQRLSLETCKRNEDRPVSGKVIYCTCITVYLPVFLTMF